MIAPLLLLALAQPPVAPAPPAALDPDRLQFAGVDDDAPVRSEAENPLEFEAYNTVLLHARRFAAPDLLAAATRDVTFRDLVAPVRQDFRLRLVALDGRLLKVRGIGPTKPLADAGVAELFECWLFPDRGDSPLCLLATELPAGLAPSALYSPGVPVTAAGYSFKLLRYESAEPNPKDPARRLVRKAPLLMGRGLILRPAPAAADPTDGWAGGFVPGLGLLVAGLAAAGFGLTAWYRRGDRAVRRDLDARRQSNPFTTDPIRLGDSRTDRPTSYPSR